MNNSAISRSHSYKQKRRSSAKEGVIKTTNKIVNSKVIDSIYTDNKQKTSNQQSLFFPFRKQSQSQKENQSFHTWNQRKFYQQKPQNSQTLFYRSKKDKEYIESMHNRKCSDQQTFKKNNKLSNQLIRTKNTFQQQFSNSFDQSGVQQNSQIKNKKLVNKKQRDFEQHYDTKWQAKKQIFDLEFGKGLQEIEENFQNTRTNQNLQLQIVGRFSQKSNNSPEKVQSSEYSKNRYTGENEYKTSARSFFKRSLSSTHSQDFLKSHQQSKVTPFYKNLKLKNSYQKKLYPSVYKNGSKRGQRQILTLANNLNSLLFRYHGAYAKSLFNYKLKIKNQSNKMLRVKIKSNCPQHYQISPCSEVFLKPLQILPFTIEMKLYPDDIDLTIMKHDLHRYKHDKFLIFYQTIDCQNQLEYFEGQRLLPVVVDQTQQEKIKNQSQIKKIHSEKNKLATQEKEIQVYKKLISNNQWKIKQIDEKIHKIQSIKFKTYFYSKSIFIFFLLIGLIFGLWLG